MLFRYRPHENDNDSDEATKVWRFQFVENAPARHANLFNCFETIPRNRDFRAAFEFQRSSHENNMAAKFGEVKKYNQGDRPRQYAGIAVNCI